MSAVPAPTTTTIPHDDAHQDNPDPAATQFHSQPTPLSQDEIPQPPASHQATIQFRASTIAPSPPPPFSTQGHDIAGKHASTGDDSSTATTPLRISTDIQTADPASASRLDNSTLSPTAHRLDRKSSSSNIHPITRTPSLKAALANSIFPGSAASSAVASPVISAMPDMTPLPSPLLSADSPGPWKKLMARPISPTQDREMMMGHGAESVLITSSGESIDAALSNAAKRRMYASLEPGAPAPAQGPEAHRLHHTRNRSLSEYVPDSTAVPRRQVTVSGSHAPIDTQNEESHIKREANLAESRGLTPTTTQPPTPPPSESSKDSVDGSTKSKGASHEYFEACTGPDQKRRRWRSVRVLGQGTFSRVMLATSQTTVDDNATDSQVNNLSTTSAAGRLDRKSLVAIKICEHGPLGGASEDRVEMSLKRELEIMQSIHHPSLVELKAWNIEPTRAILVLSYCLGGDLFDLAATHRSLLTPPLLRRIFAELVGAVEYLHEQMIVHRDIKLENVLVNLLPEELTNPDTDWTTYPYSVLTLTDLGLSRRIADDEKLETRCGSEDYAAPEVIMGQPYDGRSTDAWSLGVILYALLEARLPFDPHPGMSDTHRMRSRTSHRIARVEWRWIEYAGEDGDHEGCESRFAEKDLLGAMQITEGLLKRARSRWTLDKVASHPWVSGAIRVDGGLRFREADQGEAIS